MRLFAYAAVLTFLSAVSARSGATDEIRFRYQDGLIWLKAEVPGKNESLNFLLDSGAGVSVLDLGRARALGMRVGNPELVQGVNGRAVAYRVDDFQAVSGGITLPNSVLAINLQTISKRCHQHIDGILGIDFFRGRIVQIDFAARRVRLLQQHGLGLANCEILPIKMCNGAFCVPVQIAGNPAQWMRLDTGCDSALEWVVTRTEERRMSGPSIGLSAASVNYINISARLGKHSFNDIAAGIHTKQIFPGEDGLLGNGLLSKFCLTIDEPKSRVIFERAR